MSEELEDMLLEMIKPKQEREPEPVVVTVQEGLRRFAESEMFRVTLTQLNDRKSGRPYWVVRSSAVERNPHNGAIIHDRELDQTAWQSYGNAVLHYEARCNEHKAKEGKWTKT